MKSIWTVLVNNNNTVCYYRVQINLNWYFETHIWCCPVSNTSSEIDFNTTYEQGLCMLYKNRKQHQKLENLSFSESFVFSTNSPLDQVEVLKVHNSFLNAHFIGPKVAPSGRVYSPAKAVLAVSHCFAVSGTSAQDLNLTPELAGLHEVCDVRHSRSILPLCWLSCLLCVFAWRPTRLV